jgi:hypothetical protein
VERRKVLLGGRAFTGIISIADIVAEVVGVAQVAAEDRVLRRTR